MNIANKLSTLVLPLYLISSTVSFAGVYATNAMADAFVATGPTGNLSNNNYGGGGALAVAAGSLPNGEFQSVIKFDLSGARNAFDTQYGAGQWSLQSISLQLSSSPHNSVIYNNVAAGLFGISLMQNNSWLEGTGNASNPATNGITFNSLENVYINDTADQALGTFNFNGGTSGVSPYSLDLSPGLTADLFSANQVSLRLFAADNNVSYLFSSRAAALPSSQPELIITAIPEPTGFALLILGLGLFQFRLRPVR
jgi:hypothetical protein